MKILSKFLALLIAALSTIIPPLQQSYVTEFEKGWCIDNNGYDANSEEVDRLISVVPSKNQLAFNDLEYYNFIHFGMNTFTDSEWGTGDEDPSLFNPTELDTDQWCRVLKATGSKGIIFTAKHHDGFCLFDSAYTDHDVMSSPFGKDVVALLAESCKKYDLKLGIYLSPWDRHEETYGTDAYNDYFVNQLTELCTNYGEIFCFWFDGACGEGPNGKVQTYDWDRYYEVIQTLQPNAIISNCGPDVHWIGNEEGKVRDSEWSVIPASTVSVDAVMDGSQKEDGVLPEVDSYTEDMGSREVVAQYRDLKWSPAEADISVTTGWFYHDNSYYLKNNPFGVRSARKLAKIYFNTVGGNASLLLNVPPDTRGLISDREIETLEEFTKLIKEPFENEISCTPSLINTSGENRATDTAAVKLADDEYGISLKLDSKQKVSTIVLRENVAFSQRVEDFDIYAKKGDGYVRISDCTVIGSKKIVRLTVPVKTDEIVVIFRQSRSNPVISEISLYS
jgi:alpha-L-fucosidase